MSTVTDKIPKAPSTLSRLVSGIGLIRESWIGTAGLIILLFWVAMAVLAPILPLYDPNAQVAPMQPLFASAPDGSGTFWLGTDFKGRDILSRIIWGSQRVLFWASLATAVAYVVGMAMGAAAGYLGGWWDEVISFFGNVLLSFPVMVLYIIIITKLGPSPFNIVIAVTFASAPGIMRIVRGLVLDIRTRDYVFAAQTRGRVAALCHAGGALAQCPRSADRRCLSAHGLHDHCACHPRLPRPRPAASRSGLGRHDRGKRADGRVRRPCHGHPGDCRLLPGARLQPPGRRPSRNQPSGLGVAWPRH